MTLKNWVQSNNIQFHRNNERPWGSYELAVSTDGGVSWATFPDTFGSRIIEIDAFERTLTKYQDDVSFKEQLSNWMSHDKVIELLDIINNPMELSPNTALSIISKSG